MEPFYGDKALAEQILRWRDALGITTVVETGTGFGCDAEWFGKHFAKVYTVEIQPNLVHRARTMFRGSTVEVVQGDASKAMPSIMARIPKGEVVLYFFNAYRKDRPLLVEELRAALQGRSSFVIVVNEIQNPEQPEHAYYRWDDRHQLTLDTVRRAMDVYSPGWKHRFLDGDPAARFQVGRAVLFASNNTI